MPKNNDWILLYKPYRLFKILKLPWKRKYHEKENTMNNDQVIIFYHNEKCTFVLVMPIIMKINRV